MIFILYVATSCGFEPLYKNHTVNNLSKICFREEFIKSDDKILRSQFLINIDKIFPSISTEECKYFVKIDIIDETEALVISRDAAIERYDSKIKCNYILTDNKHFIQTNNIEVSGSFSASQSDFATYYSEYMTKIKLIENLVEELRLNIILSIKKYENNQR